MSHVRFREPESPILRPGFRPREVAWPQNRKRSESVVGSSYAESRKYQTKEEAETAEEAHYGGPLPIRRRQNTASVDHHVKRYGRSYDVDEGYNSYKRPANVVGSNGGYREQSTSRVRNKSSNYGREDDKQSKDIVLSRSRATKATPAPTR